MNTAVALVDHPAPVAALPAFSLTPRNIDEAFRLADMLATSELVPKDFRGKPGNVIVAMQWGMEVGLKPLQALQNIAVINGRPSMWGDAVIALVRSSPLCEYVTETWDAAGTAVCQVKRRGEAEQIRTFSDADAQQAGLKGKDGPWKTNPKRMKQMRARAFALRDVFADVLKGIAIAEEVMDIPADSLPTPLAQIEGTAPEVPPELLAKAQAAAQSGAAAYEKFWSNEGSTKAERHLLQFEHSALKLKASEVDAEKRRQAIEAEEVVTPAAAGGATFGDLTT